MRTFYHHRHYHHRSLFYTIFFLPLSLFSLEAHPLEEETHNRTVEVVGYLNPSSSLLILSPFQGRVASIYVKEGDKVKRGTRLFSVVKINQVGTFNQNTVYAPTSGYISQIPIEINQEVAASTPILSLIKLEYLKIQSTLSDKDAFLIDTKSPSEVDAENEILEGTVAIRPLEPDYETGLFPVEIHFPLKSVNEATRWLGRFVTAKIKTNSTTGYFVKNSAIVQQGVGPSVWTVNEDNVLLLSSIIPVAIYGDMTLLKERPEGVSYLVGDTGTLREGETFNPKGKEREKKRGGGGGGGKGGGGKR